MIWFLNLIIYQPDIPNTHNSQLLKDKGFLIAIDDFGSGHSNFDRIWSIMPNIVKLDRSLILNAVKDYNVKRIIPRITSILHESGSLVLMEGIENLQEAQIALDSDIDFVQGFFFGRPQESLFDSSADNNSLHQVWENFHHRSKLEYSDYKTQISPYYNAIGYASSLLSAGKGIEESCSSFLTLPLAKFCYLLDVNGNQIGVNIIANCNNINPKFKPLLNSKNANWARRPYFQKALQHLNKVQVSRTYLSIDSAELCRTISCSFKFNGETLVLCGDVISK